MQSATLEEVCKERGQAPYNKKSLKVQVIAADSIRSYKNDQGQEKKSMNVAIGDNSMALKCIVYDETKFSKFKQGATLILKNIIKKTDAIAVTSASKIFPTVKIEVPDHVVKSGIAIIRPPPADLKRLDEALRSPVKTRVSVMGQIIQVCDRLTFLYSFTYSVFSTYSLFSEIYIHFYIMQVNVHQQFSCLVFDGFK